MADLVAADVTYTINERRRVGRQKEHELTIAFGDGTDTYPSGGVPLTLAGLGLSRNVDSLVVMESGVSGYQYEWDKSANTIRVIAQNLRTGSTTAADSTSGSLVEDSNAAETVVRAMGAAVDTDYNVGPGKEVANAHKHPSTTLTVIAKGW